MCKRAIIIKQNNQMSQGPHYHEWKYGEPKEILEGGRMPYRKVYRFCLQCLEGEEVELKELTNKK